MERRGSRRSTGVMPLSCHYTNIRLFEIHSTIVMLTCSQHNNSYERASLDTALMVLKGMLLDIQVVNKKKVGAII